MTVHELRELLFRIENQDAIVVVATGTKYGQLTNTADIVGQYNSSTDKDDIPENYIVLSIS